MLQVNLKKEMDSNIQITDPMNSVLGERENVIRGLMADSFRTNGCFTLRKILGKVLSLTE